MTDLAPDLLGPPTPVDGVRVGPAAAARRERSVWRHRDLRVVAVSRALSFLGDEIAVVTLTLHAYDAGWGTRGVAALLVAAALPLVLAAPLAGRLVDRYDSRRLTVGTCLWQGLGALGLVAVLVAGDGTSATALALCVALVAWIGLGQAVSGPAWQALVPHVVGPGEVTRAVSALQATSMLAAIGGPALAGLLVAQGGAPLALALDAATFGLLAVGALLVRVVRRPGPDAASESAWAGLAALRADALVGPLVAGLVGVVVALQVVVVVQVFLVRGELGAGPAGYGAVNAVFATALVLGAVAAGRLGTSSGQARAAVAAVAVVSVCAVLGGFAPSLPWYAVALGCVGVAVGVLHVALHAVVLTRTAEHLRGRVVAVVTGLVQAGTVGGMALGAVVGDLAGPRTVVVAAGAASCLVCLPLAVAVRRALR